MTIKTDPTEAADNRVPLQRLVRCPVCGSDSARVRWGVAYTAHAYCPECRARGQESDIALRKKDYRRAEREAAERWHIVPDSPSANDKITHGPEASDNQKP